VLSTTRRRLMDANMLGRYVASMGAQELCTSHEQDIIDAATLEGVCVIHIHQYHTKESSWIFSGQGL
jgi:hypothetical protein